MKMNHVLAHHVVVLTWIYEIIGLHTGILTGTEEGQAVLEQASTVVVTYNHLQTAFEVLGLVEQTAGGIAFGILLRSVHIAFAIHHLIEAPVDDRTAGHTDLEDIGLSTHEVGGHESAAAPSVHSDAVGIYIGQGL